MREARNELLVVKESAPGAGAEKGENVSVASALSTSAIPRGGGLQAVWAEEEVVVLVERGREGEPRRPERFSSSASSQEKKLHADLFGKETEKEGWWQNLLENRKVRKASPLIRAISDDE